MKGENIKIWRWHVRLEGNMMWRLFLEAQKLPTSGLKEYVEDVCRPCVYRVLITDDVFVLLLGYRVE